MLRVLLGDVSHEDSFLITLSIVVTEGAFEVKKRASASRSEASRSLKDDCPQRNLRGGFILFYFILLSF